MRSIYAGVTAPISGVVCAARSAVSTVVSPRRLFSTSLKLLSTYTRRSPTATTNPVTAGTINVVPVHASRQASQAATMADVVPKAGVAPEPRPVTSAPTFMIDAIPNSDATEITFVVVSTTSSPMRCNPMVDGHDTTAPIHFTVPAGWALDHDANQFQDLTFQRVDPLPHNGERRVTSVEIDEDAHVVIVKLNARASTPSASQGSSSWSETAVECRVPFAAVLSSAIASAASRFADRKSSVVSLYPELCAALSAELPPVSINSKAYSPVHIDTVRRMVAGSPIMNGGRGRPQWTVPPAVVASAMALADPRYWLAPRASEVLAAATTRGYTLDGGDMVTEEDRREMAAKRVKILRSVARHGFAVVEHDLGVVRGVLKSDLDALTKNGTSDVPIGSTYRCEPFRTEDPEERLRRRVTGIATMIQSTFGVVRNTHYGGTSTWGDSKIVEASAEKRHTNGHHHGAQTPTHLDTAYVQTGIGLHTDNTYFAEAPKMQVFGCLHRCPVLSRGGENYVADGFAVAAKLREEDPQLFELLTQVPVVAVYCKEGRGFSGCRPVLTVDDDMDVTQVSYNPYDRAPMVGGVLSSPLLDKFYTAYARFGTLAEQNSTCFQLHVGDVLFFDNYRMLHARKAFSGPRIMGGAYIGADDTASAMVDAALRGL